uniref:Cytochrome P450 n=1 Tax=Timema monikensis TaxID=170555 RepID=A0A7R9EA78_9NEOP|nr:unnamed protein product [Timema monikensis]
MLGTGLPLIGNLQLMNILLYPLVVISGILFLYHTIQQRSRRFTLGNMIPGPPGLPLLGNALDLCTAKSAEETMKKALEMAGPYIHVGIGRIWVGPRLVVACIKPDDVETDSIQVLLQFSFPEVKFYNDNILYIIQGEIWKTHRKLIAPTFHLHVLKSFITQLNTHSNILVERLNKQVGGKSFDVHDYVAESTVDILLEYLDMAMAMGASNSQAGPAARLDADHYHNRRHPSVNVFRRLELRCRETGQMGPAQRVDTGLPDLEGAVLTGPTGTSTQHTDGDGSQSEGTNKQHFRLRYRCHEVFKTKKEEYLRHKLAGVNREIGDLSDVTQAATKGTYFDQSRGLKDDLDDDGHDTVSAGASFVICVLGAKPDIQDKVLQELDEIFGDSDRPATFNDTLNMKYLERVILETLRMFPPVPINRQAD